MSRARARFIHAAEVPYTMPPTMSNRVAYALANHLWAKVAEILAVFLVPLSLLPLATRLASGDPFRFQAFAWVANVVMLALIWAGLRLRGQRWSHFGLPLRRPTLVGSVRALGASVVVLAAALLAFVIGAIVAANLFGMPASSDTSGYGYMQGNLPMLLGALAAAWVVSSLGEEIVYRGFLITRFAELSASPPSWTIPVLASAMIFGCAHFSWGPTGIVQTAFMGLALGFAYIRTKRRLWVLVLAHAYMDTTLFVQMYLGA